MNKEFWDERYNEENFAYGHEPNVLLKEILDKLPPGKILLPAEGEGRNAVYAASKGWQVNAFDISEAGKRKAEKLAKESKVTILYEINSFETYSAPENSFDCIAMVFTHLPKGIRQTNFRKLLSFLKSGGMLIVIGFSKNQLGKSSGGPKDIDMLFSEEQLRNDFGIMKNIRIEKWDMELKEGKYHEGIGSLIQLTAIK